MAKLSSFRVDSKAKENGDWQSLGDEFGDIRVQVRGFTDAYTNALNSRLRVAARGFGGEVSKLPAQTFRAAVIATVCEKVVLDVQGVEDDFGQPMTVDAFKAKLRDADYSDVVDAVLRAASRVGISVRDDTADAAGNSDAPSAIA